MKSYLVNILSDFGQEQESAKLFCNLVPLISVDPNVTTLGSNVYHVSCNRIPKHSFSDVIHQFTNYGLNESSSMEDPEFVEVFCSLISQLKITVPRYEEQQTLDVQTRTELIDCLTYIATDQKDLDEKFTYFTSHGIVSGKTLWNLVNDKVKQKFMDYDRHISLTNQFILKDQASKFAKAVKSIIKRSTASSSSPSCTIL